MFLLMLLLLLCPIDGFVGVHLPVAKVVQQQQRLTTRNICCTLWLHSPNTQTEANSSNSYETKVKSKRKSDSIESSYVYPFHPPPILSSSSSTTTTTTTAATTRNASEPTFLQPNVLYTAHNNKHHHLDTPGNNIVATSDPTTIVTLDQDKMESEVVLETSSVEEAAQQKKQDIQFARLLLLGAAALYGTNFSCVKILGDTVPVGISSTLRFGLAAIATSPWLLQKAEVDSSNTNKNNGVVLSVPTRNKTAIDEENWGAIRAGFEVGLWNSIGYVAQAVGLQTTLASKSAFLCSLAVVTVPVLDWLTGKRLQQKQMLGAVMALVGVAFLELGGSNMKELLQFSSGDIASLIQPLAFGLGFWRMEAAMGRFPNQANRSTAAQLLAVFLGSLLYTAITEPHALVDWSQIETWLTNPSILGALVWTGIMTTAVSVYMETIALKTLSAAETTLIFSTEPVWGSIFAALIMGETFGWDAGVGGALILTACVYSNLGWSGIQEFLMSGNKDKTEKII